ncbi:MAG: TIGR02281 family clan AA aspartic protease [Limimaricola sp.]|uniref:retropepsin-like aspartic protease family protein n=1 Tax=Limimaricola sp. TaxID=2211665 RepID=UPI001D91EB9E|nr:TIGR02281 family clan AA aspartic protease [Limimaricola sp.]MBI1418284.1 TIGR02281 family clan AA aspartic protease [Limimaricola sp.]
MTGDQTANLLYLVLLGAAVAGWFFVNNRHQMGRVAQYAAVWGLIFVGTIAAVGMWGDIQRSVMPRQEVLDAARIALPRQPDGHYYVNALINGVPINFVVDTGASQVVLTQDDARRAGIDVGSLRYLGSASTANGQVQTAAVKLDTVQIGQIRDRDVRAVVNAGQMDGSLLGMSYLGRFSKIEISDGQLILTR